MMTQCHSHIRPGVCRALFIITSPLEADWRPVKNMKHWLYVCDLKGWELAVLQRNLCALKV